MVTVSISETYDLHTVVNKMTIIGIHTPKKELIQKMYPGLCMNYKYFRVKSVDVALSTAQQLPLGVDQIGLDSGQIRPQDMMNPILYKAVSNDSWSTLEYRIKGLIDQGRTSGSYAVPPLSGTMADVENDGASGVADEHGVYYALLSNRDGFRVAHPQSGLRMKGLRPIVFQKLYSDAINSSLSDIMGDTVNGIEQKASDNTMAMAKISSGSTVMRGRAVPMPRINTTYLTGIYPGLSYPGSVTTPVAGQNFQRPGMGGNDNPNNYQIAMPDIPPVMLGAIVLPPVTATTGILYYRMVCRSYIEFTDVRPLTDVTSFNDMDTQVSPWVYHSDYNEQSKSMDATTDMVDVKNAEIEKIMEGR